VHVHPEPVPVGFKKPDGIVSVTVVVPAQAPPPFVTVTVKVAVWKTVTELGVAVFLTVKSHGTRTVTIPIGVMVNGAQNWLFPGLFGLSGSLAFVTVAQLV
jgi:hypothetical protein